MKKFKVKYGLILFIYAYLRQIDLSLDRSRWVEWSEFQSYFENKINPIRIIQYLKKSFLLPDPDLQHYIISLENKTIIDKLCFIFFKNPILTEDEIVYCCKLLWNFNAIYESSAEHYNVEIEKLRINIAQYYTKVLESKIAKKDINKLMRIEHFGQNTKIGTIKLNEYIPKDF
jgi:hypothetical protein